MNNNDKTISNNEELAELFNKNFSKLVENLDTDKTLTRNIASLDITDLAFNTNKKYDYHPSIKIIKYFMGGKNLKFLFIFKQKIRF